MGIIDRLLRIDDPDSMGSESVAKQKLDADGLAPADGHPDRAPEGSLWAQQKDTDFFLPPAMTLDTLEYLSFNGDGPEAALRERFELPKETDKSQESDETQLDSDPVAELDRGEGQN